MLDKIISFFKNKIVTLIIVLLIGITSGYFFGQDNAIEELSELFIKNTTNIEIDLTPNSEEK